MPSPYAMPKSRKSRGRDDLDLDPRRPQVLDGVSRRRRPRHRPRAGGRTSSARLRAWRVHNTLASIAACPLGWSRRRDARLCPAAIDGAKWRAVWTPSRDGGFVLYESTAEDDRHREHERREHVEVVEGHRQVEEVRGERPGERGRHPPGERRHPRRGHVTPAASARPTRERRRAARRGTRGRRRRAPRRRAPSRRAAPRRTSAGPSSSCR